MTNVGAGDKQDYNNKHPLIRTKRVIIKGQIIPIGSWRLSELKKDIPVP